MKVRTGNAGQRVVSINARASPDDRGKPLFLEGTVQDVTERLENEAVLRRKTEQSLAQARLASRLNTLGEVDQIIQAVCAEAAQTLDLPMAFVVLYDPNRDAFFYAGGTGLPPRMAEVMEPVTRDGSFIQMGGSPGSAVVVQDLSRAHDLVNASMLAELGARALIAAGLVHGGELIGNLVALTSEEARIFREGELVFFQTMADLAAQALAQVYLREQFIQSQKMEAVGRLAGGVAHDFNNLLTAILGYCSLLSESLDPSDPRSGDIKQIETAAQRAAGLTRQLLAFSRKQVLQPQILDLNEIVLGAQQLLSRLLGEDIAIRTTLAPALRRVKADSGQMEQVIINLAVNARDAMPSGGLLQLETADVTLSDDYALAHLSLAFGDYVMLMVTDSGCGMNKATAARIFEPFFTTKEQGKGTGLGLSTVYGIVRQSGGDVSVQSELGGGSSFRVFLPAVETSVPPTLLEPQEAPGCVEGTETILVVEDEEPVRKLTCRSLRRLGYTVLEAAHPEEALQIVREGTGAIDLLLTDVVMPGVTGVQLSASLSARMPGMKTIFMSGYSAEAVLPGTEPPGELNFVQKPFSLSALAKIVRMLLNRP